MKNFVFKIASLIILICASTQAFADYKLAAGDIIRINVYGEVDLSFEELIIDGSEQIEYPYLGSIVTKDKSLKQVQQQITEGLRGEYLVDPKVNVSIIQYRNIYVNGVVNKPGAYAYQPDLTVEKAIALAGGFLAKYRKTKGIYLTKEGEVEGLTQDEIEELLDDKDTVAVSTVVDPGDSIYVVSSFW